MTKDEERQEARDELGRRLVAALMSYQLGVKSVDRTMKTYLSEKKVDPSWGELGWVLLEIMNRDIADQLLASAVRMLTDKIQ
jgi:hypothetical protein